MGFGGDGDGLIDASHRLIILRESTCNKVVCLIFLLKYGIMRVIGSEKYLSMDAFWAFKNEEGGDFTDETGDCEGGAYDF